MNKEVNLAKLAANILARTAFIIGYAKTLDEACKKEQDFFAKTGYCCNGKQLTTFDGSKLSISGYVLFV